MMNPIEIERAIEELDMMLGNIPFNRWQHAQILNAMNAFRAKVRGPQTENTTPPAEAPRRRFTSERKEEPEPKMPLPEPPAGISITKTNS